MSRIGKKPIKLPEGVTVKTEGSKVTITGPRGELYLVLPQGIDLATGDKFIRLEVGGEGNKATHGKARAELANKIQGVKEGWGKILEIVGTGYRASTDGKVLNLSLGFSHPVTVEAPPGIEFNVSGNKISVLGIDKNLVGLMASGIRKIKPPDVYKGKGIRYEGEVLIKKPGKAVKRAAGEV